MSYDPNKESNADRIARKKRERQEYLERQKFERENQPRDDEERRNAEAEDDHLIENFFGIAKGALRGIEGATDDDIDKFLRSSQGKKAIKGTGMSKGQARKQLQKKSKGGACALMIAAGMLGVLELAWGASSVASQIFA